MGGRGVIKLGGKGSWNTFAEDFGRSAMEIKNVITMMNNSVSY
jgi:hypothetical protein